MNHPDTSSALKYHFNETVAALQLLRRLGKATGEETTEAKTAFLSGLESVLAQVKKGTITVAGGIGETELSEMHKLAQGDWSELKPLYESYKCLTGRRYNMLFD